MNRQNKYMLKFCNAKKKSVVFLGSFPTEQEKKMGRHEGLFMSVYLCSTEGRRRRSTAADFIYFWTLLLDLIGRVHEIYSLISA